MPGKEQASNEPINSFVREDGPSIQQRVRSDCRRSPLCTAEMDGEVLLPDLR